MGNPEIVRRYTVAEYLALEEAADSRSEYFEGEIFAMAGGSPVHDMICSELGRLIGNGILGRGCETHTSNMRVRNASHTAYFYPDLSAVCDEPQYDVEGTLHNPTLIVEVLSPTTEAYDRGEKFQKYRQIPSLIEYVIVSQSKPLIEVYCRTEAGFWRLDTFEGMDARVHFRSLSIEILLSDIYRRVQFAEERLSQ